MRLTRMLMRQLLKVQPSIAHANASGCQPFSGKCCEEFFAFLFKFWLKSFEMNFRGIKCHRLTSTDLIDSCVMMGIDEIMNET